MPAVQDINELVAAIGEVCVADDPLGELNSRGFTLSVSVEQALASAQSHKALHPSEHRRWAKAAERVGPVKFQVRSWTATLQRLPVGDYDFIVGLRLELLSEVLAGLYATTTWPRELPPDKAGQFFQLADLRAFSDSVPSGDDIQVGSLHFISAPTVSPLHATDRLIVNIPFSLDIDRVRPGPAFLEPRRETITSLVGTLHFGAAIAAEFESVSKEELRFVFGGVQATPGEPEAVHIDVDQTSAVQPSTPQALGTLEERVNSTFGMAVWLGLIEDSWSTTPTVTLPIGGGVPIRVQRVDVRTLANRQGGVLLAGVLLGPTETPDEGAGDPHRLTDPLTVEAANLYARVHEAFLQKVVQQAFESGELQRRAEEERDDLVIDGANLELEPNEIRVTLDAHLVDACALGKDLGFRATKIYRYAVFGGELVVTEEQEVDLDNSDVALCVITGLFEALIAFAAFSIIGLVVDLIAQVVHFVRLIPSGAPGGPTRLSGIFNPNVPVSGTELLPRIEVLQSLIEEDALRGFGVGTLREDDVNTYIYAAFVRGSGFLNLEPRPLAGVRVELVDQDVPPPPGDDVAIPEEERTRVTGEKIITTTTRTFEPPLSDEVLSSETTNGRGRVRFFLRPHQLRTSGGKVVTSIETRRLDTDEVDVQREEAQVEESQPDVYFRLRLPGGNALDTRPLPSGFVLNLQQKRIGRADAPVTFVIP